MESCFLIHTNTALRVSISNGMQIDASPRPVSELKNAAQLSEEIKFKPSFTD